MVGESPKYDGDPPSKDIVCVCCFLIRGGWHDCPELEMRLTQAIARAGRTDVEVRQEDHIPLESIPGLLIDGQLISQREVPTIETLLEWFETVPAQRKD